MQTRWRVLYCHVFLFEKMNVFVLPCPFFRNHVNQCTDVRIQIKSMKSLHCHVFSYTIHEDCCAVVFFHTNSMKTVTLSCYLSFKVNEKPCAVELFHTKSINIVTLSNFCHTQSMKFVAPSCFFIQNRCKPLHCRFFNKKSTNVVARSCFFH